MMRSVLSTVLFGATALTSVWVLAPAQAHAATATAAENTSLGEITVTARRRDESLVDVPLAISVVTADKIEKLDLQSTADLANFTPGLTFNNFTPLNARNDRGPDRPIVIRGLNLGIGGQQGATLFLDGAAVAGNEVPAGMDIGAVEVLRGPQSVYFGRSTMTGAVSYRTKSIPDKIGGQVAIRVAQQGDQSIEGTIAGPVAPGLKLRVTGLVEKYDGYVTNNFNNGADDLGATSRKSISVTAIVTPAQGLEFKAYANYFRNDDGQSASAFLPPALDNCKFPGATYRTFCGEIPGRSNSINYANTVIPKNIADVIFSTPLIKDSDFDKKIGSQSEVLNTHLVGNWEINDYLTLQSITGYHKNINMNASDGLGQPSTPAFTYANYMYTYATKKVDVSQELRLSSNSDRRFSWTLGGNYIRQNTRTSAYVGWIPNTAPFFFYKQPIVPSYARTLGAFGGAYYKVTDALTVSAEARYQSDEIRVTTFEQTFNAFSPRVSVDYDVGGGRKVYASYSEGNQPGGFNTSIESYRSNALAFSQIQQLLGVSNSAFDEEKLKIGELGFKGNLPNGKGYFDINAYYGQLLNQQVYENVLIPALGFSVSATNNAGESKAYGLEFQGNYNLTSELSLTGTFAWNHAERTKYFNLVGAPQFGTTNYDGKQFAYVPVYSGSLIVDYTHPITDMWNGFANATLVYRGKQFADEFNASYIPSRVQVDVRAGVKNETYSLELFIKNLFDDQKYTGGNVTPDYGTSTYYGFFGAWAPPRQFGARVRANF